MQATSSRQQEQQKSAASCEACRLTGTATFAGISGYLLYELSRVPVAARGHRLLLKGMAAASASAAVWRFTSKI